LFGGDHRRALAAMPGSGFLKDGGTQLTEGEIVENVVAVVV
jgi:hypothetical protein